MEHDEGDILVISRGGGENIQLFNNTDLAEAALTLNSIFVTAIDHSDDEPLLQKVADKAFITLGQFLYDVYIHTLEDLSNSKARLIGDLAKQIELNFQYQLTDLNTRLADTSRAYQELAQNADLQQRQLLHAFSRAKRKNNILIILLVLAIALLLLYLFENKR